MVLAALAVLPFLLGDYPRALVAEIFIFAIFAMSLDLLLGFTGLMSLGHAAFFGLGAYAVAVLGVQFGLNAWLGVAAGVVIAGAGAALIGFFCVRTGGIPFLMLTLAFSQLVFSVALKWRDVTGGSDGMAIAEQPGFFGFSLSKSLVMYFMALSFFALTYWGLRRLLNSPLGHAFVGIRENEQRMLAIGYPTRAYKLISFTIAGAIAGLAGGLYAIFNGFISSDAVYWTSSGDILIMTMLGGAGTLIGPAIGAAVFLLMKNVASSYSEHWLSIIGVTFICCVMFFPGGLWGTLQKVEWRRARQMSVLRLDHLNKAFGSLVVTDDVCLDIAPGERHVIIGPNGAGKTSLVNQIGGQLRPSSGRILLKGSDITGLSPDRISRMGVARTFQRNNLFQNLSVIENIRLALEVHRGHPLDFFTPVGRNTALSARAEDLMAQVHLDTDGARLTRKLSYGEQRQLEIGVALAGEPELLLLDEPTSGMSPTETARMIDLIATLPRTLSILMIEHDMKVVFSVADRITVLYYGKVLATGTPADIQANARVREVYLGMAH